MALQQRGGVAGPALAFELAAADPAGALLLGTARRATSPTHPEQHKAHGQQHGALPAAPRPPQTPHAAPSHDAARLNAQLRAIQPPAAPLPISSSSSSGEAGSPAAAGWGQRLRGLALRVGDMTQPSGEAPGDATWGERTTNVLTSLPFLALGWHMHRWVGAASLAAAGCSTPNHRLLDVPHRSSRCHFLAFRPTQHPPAAAAPDMSWPWQLILPDCFQLCCHLQAAAHA